MRNLDTAYAESDRSLVFSLRGEGDTDWSNVRWYGNIPAYADSTDPMYFTGLAPSSPYFVRAMIRFPSGTTYWFPSEDGTMYWTAASPRPALWNWTNGGYAVGGAVQSGSLIKISAAEWNSFTAHINAVREYRGYSNYGFIQAYSGNNIAAIMYNQAVNAIKGIAGYGTYVNTVNSGDRIHANHFNSLRSEINAVP